MKLDLKAFEKRAQAASAEIARYTIFRNWKTYQDYYAEDIPNLVQCVKELRRALMVYVDQTDPNDSDGVLLTKWGLG